MGASCGIFLQAYTFIFNKYLLRHQSIDRLINPEMMADDIRISFDLIFISSSFSFRSDSQKGSAPKGRSGQHLYVTILFKFLLYISLQSQNYHSLWLGFM